MRAVIVMLCTVALAACGDGQPAGRQVGVWGLDDESLVGSEEFTTATKGWTEKQRKIHVMFAQAMAGMTTLELTKDRLILQMVIGQKEVPYTVKSSNGDDVVLDVIDGNQKKELKLTLQGSDEMVTDMASGQWVRFKRLYGKLY